MTYFSPSLSNSQIKATFRLPTRSFEPIDPYFNAVLQVVKSSLTAQLNQTGASQTAIIIFSEPDHSMPPSRRQEGGLFNDCEILYAIYSCRLFQKTGLEALLTPQGVSFPFLLHNTGSTTTNSDIENGIEIKTGSR